VTSSEKFNTVVLSLRVPRTSARRGGRCWMKISSKTRFGSKLFVAAEFIQSESIDQNIVPLFQNLVGHSIRIREQSRPLN
jgi:hypothetical protein